MMLGNSQRGNTVSLRKIKEFEDAGKDEDQELNVKFCSEHKTMTSRTTPFEFPMPKVYRATKKYTDLFR